MSEPTVPRPSRKDGKIDWTRYGFKRAPRLPGLRSLIEFVEALPEIPESFYGDQLQRLDDAERRQRESTDRTSR